MSWQQKIRGFWSQSKWLNKALLPLSLLYYLGHLINYHLLSSPKAVKPFVICVGNIVIGGAGKTLFAIELARKLIALGYKVAFVSRGYGASIKHTKTPIQVDLARHNASQVGDEPLLLAAIAPTFVCVNRFKAALMANVNQPDIIIMDDGLQNNQLVQDYRFLITDADYAFGNKYILPAGPLREPFNRALKDKVDCTVLILNSKNSAQPKGLNCDLEANIVLKNKPDDTQKYYAFCSLANPQKFYRSLIIQGFCLSMTKDFKDHHLYSPKELNVLSNLASQYRLITTEKDIVKIPHDMRKSIESFKIGLEFDIPQGLLAKLSSR